MSASVLNCLHSPEVCREPISTESHFPPSSTSLPPSLFFSHVCSEALGKMKDVYEKNPQMGDPASLASQINQTSQNIERLRGELNKYEVIPASVFHQSYMVCSSDVLGVGSDIIGFFFVKSILL